MRLFSAAPQSLEQTNFHHLVQDIAWFGLALPATTRFLQVYAIRLGAKADELSILTSLPAIILLISASLGSRWMAKHNHDCMKAVFWPALIFRLQFLLPALTPFMPVSFQPLWLVLSLALPALAQGIASVVFLIMMREAVPDEQIASLVSRRSLAMNLTLALSGLALGLWLEKAPFPFNYQAMFVVAFLLAMISLWHVMKIHILPVPVPSTNAQAKPIANPWRSQSFQQVAFITSITHIAFFAIYPLTPLHLIKNLDANEFFMGLFALAELVAGAGITLATAYLIRRFGHRAMIAFAMAGTGIGSIILALTPSLGLALPAGALAWAAWTTATISMFAHFSESTPHEDKAPYTVAYMQVISVATFVGPMIGSGLSKLGISLVAIILIGGALRLLSAVLTHFHTLEWFERKLNIASFSR